MGKHGRNERNTWVWRICKKRNISLLHFHFTCGFFVCVLCYLPSPGSAQHSATGSTVITVGGGGGGCCRFAEMSLSMVSLHFRCLCRCAQSHSFPIPATHTYTILFSFFLTFVACCWNPLKSLFQLFDVVATQTLPNGTKVIEFFLLLPFTYLHSAKKRITIFSLSVLYSVSWFWTLAHMWFRQCRHLWLPRSEIKWVVNL